MDIKISIGYIQRYSLIYISNAHTKSAVNIVIANSTSTVCDSLRVC